MIVASSRGGLYAPGMPFEANDFQERYLRAVFAFIGIRDIEIIRAEGLALGPAHRDARLRTAEDLEAEATRIERVTTPSLAAAKKPLHPP
jgi:FMN-dependent NADH-azoreductase